MPAFTNFTPDESDPSWGTATDEGGQEHVVTATFAEANMAPMGPPEPTLTMNPNAAPLPSEIPLDQGLAAMAPPPEAPAMAPAEPVTLPTEVDLVNAARGAAPGTPGFVDSRTQMTPLGDTADPNGRIDPGAQPLEPAGGGMALAGGSQTQGVQSTERYADPVERAEATGQAYDQLAEAEKQRAEAEHRARLAENAKLLQATSAREEQLQREQRRAQLEVENQQKLVKAMEDTPIDENAFWNEAPGRKAAAWIALALSGFLQGVTKGQNPALNQMMGALNDAVNRHVQTQRANKDSQLRIRERMLGDSQTALRSVEMQLLPLIEKRATLEAQKAGLAELPPALSTAAAKLAVDREGKKNEILMQTKELSTRQEQQEFKAVQASPRYQADRELLQIGVPRERYDQLVNKEGYGEQVTAADRLREIKAELDEIAKRNGGTLPNQQTIRLRGPAKEFWARQDWADGFTDAKDQVKSEQLLQEALGMLKSGNMRIYDNVKEAEAVEKRLNSGETSTTLSALDGMFQQANKNVIARASGVTGNPQALIDFVRRTQKTNPGVDAPAGGAKAYQPPPWAAPPEKPAAGAPQAQQPPATEEAAIQATGGGPAPRPLAQSPRELQRVIQSVEGISYNPDALARIIHFESGGKPGIVNPKSGATGAIQWMPKVFASMEKPPGYEGVRFEDLPDLTLEEQLPLVEAYFKERGLAPDADAGEMYLAVAAPAFLGKDDGAVVYRKGSKAWEQNPAWRPAGGGDITVGDIRAKGRSL